MKNDYENEIDAYNKSDPNWKDIVFRVNYNKNLEPYISVNGHWISRPHRFSDIDIFFEYVHRNPHRTITSEDVKRDLKINLKKGMDDILHDLGFKGYLAKLFFTKMTHNEIHFVNPAYQSDLKRLGIDYMDIYKLLFTPKRKGASTMIR